MIGFIGELHTMTRNDYESCHPLVRYGSEEPMIEFDLLPEGGCDLLLRVPGEVARELSGSILGKKYIVTMEEI